MDPYAVLVETLEQLMHDAHRLGLYRTAYTIHQALDSAAYERQEVPPPSSDTGTVTWRIGPIREQSTRK